MIEALLLGTVGGPSSMGYWQPPAIYRRVQIECRPQPTIGAPGTGGLAGAAYYQSRMGYQPIEVINEIKALSPAPYVEMMESVKTGFGRTMSRLPEVFGVSRQTLYNWLSGDTPREAHQAKLRQLSEAATVFKNLGFKPSSDMLDKTLFNGKSFLQLIGDGSDGREAAQKLVRLSKRAADSRSRLDDLLGGRRARLGASDLGAPTLDESA